jgi:hypothetical protein
LSPASNPKAKVAAWLAFGYCALAAFWTAEGVGPWTGDEHNAWHHYEYLTEGFLHGHTYLSVDPDPRLLALPDPYNPEQNKPYRLWDASLYDGKYYLYYGPAPAIVLMLPWRILTGRELPQNLAVAAFAAVGLAALVLLLGGIRERHFPRLSPLGLAGVVTVAFHAAWLPVILRRPAFWEVPIVSAVACLWWAVYFLWKFQDSGKIRWAVGGGIALALLMGCRVTFVFAAAAVAFLYLVPRAGAAARCLRGWALALAPAAIAFAGGLALLAYNYARFGRWLEFGQSYQLWGVDYRGMHFFGLRNVLFNVQAYLLSLPQFGPYFPFLHPFSAVERPAGYMGFEEPYGIIFMMPVHLAGILGLAWAWKRRAEGSARATALAVAAGSCAALFAALVLFSWGAACSRYIAELVAGWTVVSSVGLMALLAGGAGERPRRVPQALAVAAGCWTVACVWLASAEFRGFMALTHPRTYAAFAHALDYPSLWWARARDIRFGPVALTVRVPPEPAGRETTLVASGRPQRVNLLLLESFGGERVRLDLIQNEFLIVRTPALEARGGRLDVRVDAPWLYPPRDHPYWDAFDPRVARERQTLFRLEVPPSTTVSEHSIHTADPVAFEPAVAGTALEGTGSPCVETVRAAPSAP